MRIFFDTVRENYIYAEDLKTLFKYVVTNEVDLENLKLMFDDNYREFNITN